MTIDTRLTEALAELAEEAGTYATADAVLAAAGRRRRRRTTALAAGAAVGVLAVSLGAAAVGARDAAPDHVVGPDQDRWVSCAEQAPKPPPRRVRGALSLPRLPADFVPTTVVICRPESQPRDGGGLALVGTELRGTDISALVAALRLPDAGTEPGPDVFCRLDRWSYPWMALLDADGAFVRPGPPAAPCGQPRAEVIDAIAALKLTRVDSRVYDTREAPGPAAARCEASLGDRVWIEGPRSQTHTGPGGQALAGTARVGLCEYHVSAGELDTPYPVGDLARGLVLPQPRRELIEQALTATGPARPCTASAGRFALLMPQDGGSGEVYVELDGCQRVLTYLDQGRGTVLSQGGPELTRLLDES